MVFLKIDFVLFDVVGCLCIFLFVIMFIEGE